MIVVDASAVLEVLLQTPRARAAEAELFGGTTLNAPHLLDLEVAQVLRRYEHGGVLTAPRAAAALRVFADLPVVRYPHDVLLTRVWALRENATSYDAAYLALAEALDAPLVTSDRRLAGVPGHTARVRVLE